MNKNLSAPIFGPPKDIKWNGFCLVILKNYPKLIQREIFKEHEKWLFNELSLENEKITSYNVLPSYTGYESKLSEKVIEKISNREEVMFITRLFNKKLKIWV